MTSHKLRIYSSPHSPPLLPFPSLLIPPFFSLHPLLSLHLRLSPSLSLSLSLPYTPRLRTLLFPGNPLSLSPSLLPPLQHLPVSPLPHPAFLLSGSPLFLPSLRFQGLFLQLCLCFSPFFSSALVSFPTLLPVPQAPLTQALSRPLSCGSPFSRLFPHLLCGQRGGVNLLGGNTASSLMLPCFPENKPHL